MTSDAVGFDDAAVAHLRDALSLPVDQRLRWLQQAIACGVSTARARAAKGLISLGPHGDLMWSPRHEALWAREHRLPSDVELMEWSGTLSP